MKKWSSDYKLVGSFKFLLRSTIEIQALGFKEVPLYHVASLPKAAAKYPKMRRSSVTPSSKATNTEHCDSEEEEEEEESLFVEDEKGKASLPPQTPQSASDGRSRKAQSATFSNGGTEEQTPESLISILNRSRHEGLKLPDKTPLYALQDKPAVKIKEEADPVLIEDLKKFNEVTTSIRGLKGGPAQAAWNDRDNAALELSIQRDLETKQTYDVRQSPPPPRTPTLMDGEEIEFSGRHPPMDSEDLALFVLPFTPLDSTLHEVQGSELPGDQQSQNSQSPTEVVDEEYIEALFKSELSQTTVDGFQVPHSQITSNITSSSFDVTTPHKQSRSSPRVPLGPSTIDGVTYDPSQQPHTPETFVHHTYASSALGSTEEPLSAAVSSDVSHSEIPLLPRTPHKGTSARRAS